MMAIGEQLQEAVASKRKSKQRPFHNLIYRGKVTSADTSYLAFLDDICGISFSVRFTSININIWNRDGDHEAGINNILKVILENLPSHLAPKESSYYYKKHADHAGFSSIKGAEIDTKAEATKNSIPPEDDAKSPTDKS